MTIRTQCIPASYERTLVIFFGLMASGPKANHSDFSADRYSDRDLKVKQSKLGYITVRSKAQLKA